MSDGLWACRDCGNVVAGPSNRPPDRPDPKPCPACGYHDDSQMVTSYRKVDR